jgi:hypothetical protein
MNQEACQRTTLSMLRQSRQGWGCKSGHLSWGLTLSPSLDGLTFRWFTITCPLSF